jgi:hypothetical protein
MGIDSIRVRSEIEDAPHAFDDHRQRREPRKADRYLEGVSIRRLHGNDAVPSVDLDRAYVLGGGDVLDARDRACLQNAAMAGRSYGGRYASRVTRSLDDAAGATDPGR